MGCQQSAGAHKPFVFGANGLHVGRDGDVDLTSRSMDVFGPRFVELIKRDRFHTARRLHLSENKLYTLGKEMIRLPDLEELYINSNRFERLPVVLGEMKSLEVLDASKNPLDHQRRSLDVLPRIANLKNLALRGCMLTTLPPCVLQCITLRDLDLSDNIHLKLNDVDFSVLSSLRSLAVANCGISGDLPPGIKKIEALEVLDISENTFDFEVEDFFGKRLAASLTELHLRGLGITMVPQVVVSLGKLSSLDLAKNPIETLDVLAGRLVRKLAVRNTLFGSSSNGVAELNDDSVSIASHCSTRLSVSQLSRAGRIAYVAQPIPLKKLSLRSCGLRTVPKYFHKLTGLIEIDLSDNDSLNDPNLTLFSFSNLQVLTIVGCPFARNHCAACNEWFDIAKLRNLHTIKWEEWKETHNASPYSTKVPLEICGLRLQHINGIKVRPGLFVGDTVQTAINLLSDGYFKVDLALNEDLVYSHAEAVHALNPLRSFFFLDNSDKQPGGGDASAMGREGVSPSPSALRGSPSLSLTRPHVFQIVINRYIFFLSLQAANYDTVIIPPADVMAVHYAQMIQDPIRYRSDCEAICGQVLSCNYRLFFFEKKMRPHSVKDALDGSKRVWNIMVHTAQKDPPWLRYEFWEHQTRRRTGATSAPTAKSDNNADPHAGDDTLAKAAEASIAPAAPLCGPDYGMEIGDLQDVDSVTDLCAILEKSITSHFMEQGIDRFVEAIDKFFHANMQFLKHEEVLRTYYLDWTRYAKYLALYAQIQRMKWPENYSKRKDLIDDLPNLSFVTPSTYLPRPLTLEMVMPTAPLRKSMLVKDEKVQSKTVNDNDNTKTTGCVNPYRPACDRNSFRAPNSDAGGNRRQRNQAPCFFEPVPTIGLTLLLHSHRTAHAKYYRTLELLGIENVDVVWENTRAAVEATMKTWMAVYNEHYVKNTSVSFDMQDSQPLERGDACVGTKRSGGTKRTSRNQRRVAICGSSDFYSII